MMLYKRKIIFLIPLLFVITFSSCFEIKDKRTTVSVVDPNRHYLPILFGQKLEIVYKIENTGDEPLFIENINVSGGCQLITENEIKVLPVGKKGYIRVCYDGTKNIGYVKNYVTIYANFKSTNKEELTFDLKVVPNSSSVKDYEEIYSDKNEHQSIIKESLDDSMNERKYYTD